MSSLFIDQSPAYHVIITWVVRVVEYILLGQTMLPNGQAVLPNDVRVQRSL